MVALRCVSGIVQTAAQAAKSASEAIAPPWIGTSGPPSLSRRRSNGMRTTTEPAEAVSTLRPRIAENGDRSSEANAGYVWWIVVIGAVGPGFLSLYVSY